MLETRRLLIRKYTPEDLPEILIQRGAEEVARYLGGISVQTPEFIEKRLHDYFDYYQTFGFGPCAMIWKETGANIGWSGLAPLEDSGEIEVGYGMKKEFWRRRIGFECALAWLKYGFETAKLERIVAVASEENKGSWRIMEKCGMKFEGRKFHYGGEVLFYAISRQDFFRLQSE